MENIIQVENIDEALEQQPTSSETTAKSKRLDPVWQYYVIDPKKKQWYCKLCKKPRMYKYTTECPSSTSAKEHLKNKHSEEFKTLENEVKKSGNAEIKKVKPKKQPLEPNQTQLNLPPVTTYPPGHWKQQKFEERIVRYACNPTVTIYQLKSDEFRGLFEVVDPKLKIPGDYKAFKGLIGKFYAKRKEQLTRQMAKISKYSAMLDIWSDSNMNHSYLGVSLQFCDGDTLKRAFLEMQPLTEKHTGLYIRQIFLSILNDFDLSEEALLRVVTDNASNMIKAFQFENSNESDESEDEEEIQFDRHGFEIESDEFGEFEADNEFGCTAHSINLALLHVMKNHLMKLEGFNSLKKLINHFNKSHESKKKLVEAAGVSLIQFCPTRWAQWLKAMARFLEVKEHVRKIARTKALGFPNQEEINHFQTTISFLKPIVDLLEMIQAENSATISMVFPRLKIFLHDAEHQSYSENSFMGKLRKDFCGQIRTRFAFILERDSDKFDRYFLLATLLDPNYCWLMDEADEFWAKLYLKNSVKNPLQGQQLPPVQQQTQSLDGMSAFERMKAEKRLKTASSIQMPATDVEKAIDAYSAWAKDEMAEKINPIEFWLKEDPRWNVLSEFALHVLSIPATSAAQERIFSYAGIASEKRRSRIGTELLNQKLFIHLNKKLFD